MAEPAASYAVQSLERAAALLGSFNLAQPELTISELARRTNLPRSTVHRLAANLTRLGFLNRDARTERYRLGLLLAQLGTIALSRLGLREKARPVMERLADQTGEVVCLAVLERNHSVYIEVVEGRHGLRLRATVGGVAPLHASATGTVLLAHLPEAEMRRRIAETGLPRYTGRTITDTDTLLNRLETIRRRGYSVDEGETEEGLTGLAAPVCSAAGRVEAALVVAGPGPRVLGDEPDRCGRLVAAAADEISASLGYEVRDAPLTRGGSRHPRVRS
jgi:IclR family transcriptional regulator, KDG regulon repressor